MGLLDVLTRVQRLDGDLTSIHIEDNDSGSDCDITVDSELSTTSENPVQNKVITSAINDLRENKEDYSPYIRKIYIGTQATPSDSLGDDGDLYIYLPN